MPPKVVYGQKSSRILKLSTAKEDKSLAELVPEMRKDAYVCLAERDIRATVATAQVSVTTESPDPRTQVLAVNLDEIWRTHVTQMLESYAYGRQAFEVVFVGVAAGLGIHAVQRLEPLPFEQTEPMIDDESLLTDGVILKGKDDEGDLELPGPYGWWLALDATALNPHGVSRFRGAMEATYKRRDELLGKLSTFVRKYALGDDIVYAPETRLGPNGQQINVWDEIGKMYAESEGGDLKIFPNETEQRPDGTYAKTFEVDRAALGARDGSPLMSLAKDLGAEILLAATIPPRTVLEGDSGSFALVTWQMLVKFAAVEDILSQIVASFQKKIVGSVERMNGVSGIVCNYVPLTQRPDDLVVELARSWLKDPALSPLVLSGKVDVRKVLEMAGIPISDKSSDFLAGLPQQQAGGPSVAQMAAPSFRLWR